MKHTWQVADLNPGNDIGVTFGPLRRDGEESDAYVLSIHVWQGHSEQCLIFAKKLCDLLNAENFAPPDVCE